MIPVVYTETLGTTCYLDDRRGAVTGLRYGLSNIVRGAFVFVDDEQGEGMAYAELGRAVGARRSCHEVTSWRFIDRDEFDKLNGIADLRREMGWRS